MKLCVISPHGIVYHTIVWAEINTPAGNMVIQENHAPMIVEIQPNSEILFMQPNGKQVSLIVIQGFMHITRQEIKLLVTQEA
jgi:F0F1-type ATP synthase epsilon subunit